MEVILVEDVPNLGGTGDLVKVAPGYGRNFLLPRKLAIVASVKNQRQLEHEKRLAGFRKMKAKADAESVAKKLTSLSVTIARRVGDQDKLFGSVTTHDIQQALEAQGVSVDRRKMILSDAIKTLGNFQVPVRLSEGIIAELKVIVVAE